MNHRLAQIATDAGLNDPRHRRLRLGFGLACARRVEHLLEDADAKAGLVVLAGFVVGREDEAALRRAAEAVASIARRHPGSVSIDGAAHAAVSATHALARAMNDDVLEAADYAAYALVYAYAGHAVDDPAAFEAEFAWQADELRALLTATPAPARPEPPTDGA